MREWGAVGHRQQRAHRSSAASDIRRCKCSAVCSSSHILSCRRCNLRRSSQPKSSPSKTWKPETAQRGSWSPRRGGRSLASWRGSFRSNSRRRSGARCSRHVSTSFSSCAARSAASRRASSSTMAATAAMCSAARDGPGQLSASARSALLGSSGTPTHHIVTLPPPRRAHGPASPPPGARGRQRPPRWPSAWT